ncbi:MAG: disulfide bond formation protein B [Gammaproteobacteria bacterium]|nr:disulfide bond formation protein B [Gammaproteobacteria bacterium]
MLNKWIVASQSKYYWLLLILLGISLEAVALFYQYGLGEWPCLLCIHVRIWVMAFIIVALLALLFQKHKLINSIFHLITAAIMFALVERSWQLLATERGWTFGSCDMELGVPPWFALDKWFPLVFEVQTSCGYTPQLLFGITMAEALMIMSVMLALVAVILSGASFIRR